MSVRVSFEIEQKLLDSQKNSIKEQLLNVGIRVVNKKKLLGYVDTIGFTLDPIKVTLRYDDQVTPISEKQLTGFKFVTVLGRFVLAKK